MGSMIAGRRIAGYFGASLLALAAGCSNVRPALIPLHANALGALRVNAKTQSALLYVSSSDKVYVFSYPQGKKLQTLTGLVTPSGLCSDGAGNVFVTNFGGQSIVEYAHGGTAPIATLHDPYEQPNDCAVDPTTGNLAVANIDGSVSIYKQSRGKPKRYADGQMPFMLYLAYDSRGNLFVDGENADFDAFELAEQPAGSKSFSSITLDHELGFPGGIQWDGQYVAIADQDASLVHRFAIHGNSGASVGTVTLSGAIDIGEFWNFDSSIVAADMGKRDVGVWNYPGGEEPTETISGFREPLGVTISVVK
jgi:sugar lactone lactonase YvrE